MYVLLFSLLSNFYYYYHHQRLAYFANLYNAMIIHALCVLGAPEDSPQGRSQFFRGHTGANYRIGGYDFSPDDIEHGILRGNYPHPSQVTNDPLTSSPSFWPVTDPRAVLLPLPYLDPRIHFILNCGASSCPPIRVLSGEAQETELALASAARAYLTGEIKSVRKKVPRFQLSSTITTSDSTQCDSNNASQERAAIEEIEDDVLYIPRLILWYGADFGKDIKTRIARLMTLVRDESDSNGDSNRKIRKESGSVDSVYETLRNHLNRYDESEIRKILDISDTDSDVSINKTKIREYEAYLDTLVEYNVYNWATNSYDES